VGLSEYKTHPYDTGARKLFYAKDLITGIFECTARDEISSRSPSPSCSLPPLIVFHIGPHTCGFPAGLAP